MTLAACDAGTIVLLDVAKVNLRYLYSVWFITELCQCQ